MALQCRILITFEHDKLHSCPFFPLLQFFWTYFHVCPSSSCVSNTDEYQRGNQSAFIKLITEVSVELEPLTFLFVQQEAIDVGEELI